MPDHMKQNNGTILDKYSYQQRNLDERIRRQSAALASFHKNMQILLNHKKTETQEKKEFFVNRANADPLRNQTRQQTPTPASKTAPQTQPKVISLHL